MDAARVMALLAEACAMLEQGAEHAAAAHVGQAMELLSAHCGVPVPAGDPPCGDTD